MVHSAKRIAHGERKEIPNEKGEGRIADWARPPRLKPRDAGQGLRIWGRQQADSQLEN